MKLTCRQQKLVTKNNSYSVKENLEDLCSYYIYKQNKKTSIDYNFKMAEWDGNMEYYRELLNMRGMGRAWQLWNAIQDVRRREGEGQGSSSLWVPLGRMEIEPWGLTRKSPNMCQGRARGRGFPSNLPPHPGGRGRGRALPPPSPHHLRTFLMYK